MIVAPCAKSPQLVRTRYKSIMDSILLRAVTKARASLFQASRVRGVAQSMACYVRMRMALMTGVMKTGGFPCSTTGVQFMSFAQCRSVSREWGRILQPGARGTFVRREGLSHCSPLWRTAPAASAPLRR